MCAVVVVLFLLAFLELLVPAAILLVCFVVGVIIHALMHPEAYEDNNAVYRPQGNHQSNYPSRANGGVYLFECGGQYKIGRSVDFDRRLGEFRHQLPYKPSVVHKIYCSPGESVRLEKELHRRYAHKRGHGEWFQLSPHEIEEIKRRR